MASSASRAGWPSRGPPATMPPVCVDLAISQTGGSATRGSARVYGGDRRRGTRAGTGAVPDARQPPGGRQPPPRRASSHLRPRRGPGRTARRASSLPGWPCRRRGTTSIPPTPPAASVPPAAVARPDRTARRTSLRASAAGRAGRGERRRPRPPRGRTARRFGVPTASAADEALAGIQPALPARHAGEGEHRRPRPPRRSRPRYMRPAAALGWPDAGELGSNPSPRRSRPRPGGLTQANAARSRRPLVGR